LVVVEIMFALSAIVATPSTPTSRSTIATITSMIVKPLSPSAQRSGLLRRRVKVVPAVA
jgi:hypothetical protein